MWMMPTGLPSSTTNSAVNGRSAWFIIASAALTSMSGAMVFGDAVMMSPTEAPSRSGAHVTAQIAIGDDADERAASVDDAKATKASFRHDDQRIAPS